MDEQTQLAESVERLTKVVGDLERDFYRKRTFWWSFSHGLLYGVGTVLGAVILVGLLFFLAGKLGNIPLIGDFFKEIMRDAEKVKEIKEGF